MKHKPSKIRSLIAEGESILAQSPHPERARRDAEAILLHLFRATDPARNRAWLFARQNDPTLAKTQTEFTALIERRLAGEPIQYITGEAEFYGLPFRVTPAVLIPRPETEHLVEKALEMAAGFAAPRMVDVGTGSGAIPVALARHLPQAIVSAIDLSSAALEIARGNAADNAVAERIRFLEGDLLEPVASERFEIVVSNPPYVPLADRASLSVEVREHEPALALFAGEDGLELYRRLIPQAFKVLVAGGFLGLEIGCGQEAAVRALLEAAGFAGIRFIADLQGIPRVACATRPRL
jgi:release factor glutamine methyltransferase